MRFNRIVYFSKLPARTLTRNVAGGRLQITSYISTDRECPSMMEILQNQSLLLQQDISDDSFLQSEEWQRFQAATGRKTFHFPARNATHSVAGGEGENFWANAIEQTLPVVGKYWYVPRGPIVGISNFKFQISNQSQIQNSKFQNVLHELIGRAQEEKAGWIRIDPANEELLRWIQENVPYKVVKAPHDMQPREILVMDIMPEPEMLLQTMKPKTRYNIRLAEKKGVKVFTTREQKYLEIFLDLVEVTAKRDHITPHPRVYYEKMFQVLPQEMLRLFIALHEGEVLAANLVLFFGRYAMYLHGASSNRQRSLMAPYLLQWRQILDARERGYTRYDFGGVKVRSKNQPACRTGRESRIKGYSNHETAIETDNSWAGITRFKRGFAPDPDPIVFPGSYDIILNILRYRIYLMAQGAKGKLKKCLKNLTNKPQLA